jgi:hypothetical protein
MSGGRIGCWPREGGREMVVDTPWRGRSGQCYENVMSGLAMRVWKMGERGVKMEIGMPEARMRAERF